MAETPTNMSNESCCKSACGCDCPARLAKLEKTVHRIRLWLFIALGVLILLVGIGIGKDQARQQAMRAAHAGPMPQGPGPQGPGPGNGPMAQPGPQGPPMGQPPMQGADRRRR